MRTRLQWILLLLLTSGVVAAPSFTLLKGDKDGFNRNFREGGSFDWKQINPQAGDEAGTDTWLLGPRSWRFSLDGLGGVPQTAQLGIFHGGDGLGGPSEVLVNGIRVGYLTDADNHDDRPGNTAWYDLLDLTSVTDQLTGSILLTVNTAPNDGWAVDYIELTTSGELTASVVPAPGTLLLGTCGILLTGWLRRRKSL